MRFLQYFDNTKYKNTSNQKSHRNFYELRPPMEPSINDTCNLNMTQVYHKAIFTYRNQEFQ